MELSKKMKLRIEKAIYKQMDCIEDKLNKELADILIEEQIIPRENPKWIDALAYTREIFFRG